MLETGKVSIDEATHQMIVLLATGRASLAFIYGDKQRRFDLLSPVINWDRVLISRLDGQPVGFLSFQWNRTGPYMLKARDFHRVFGVLSGTWRWLFHEILERRTWHRGFYVYGLKVVLSARRRGVGSDLLNAARQVAQSLSVTEISLDVYRKNQAGILFFQTNGFSCQDGDDGIAGVKLLPVMKMISPVHA